MDMKKVCMMLALLLLFAGCGKEDSTENLAIRCQKANNYEFYSSTNIIGVYNTEEGKVTKIEFVENFTPKWEDVRVEDLQKQLAAKKANLEKKYEQVEFIVDTYKKDVTSDYIIPLTEKNLLQLKKEEAYQNIIQGDLFSTADYLVYLQSLGYVCE